MVAKYRLFRTEVTAISYSKTAFFIEPESSDLMKNARPFIPFPVSLGWRQAAITLLTAEKPLCTRRHPVGKSAGGFEFESDGKYFSLIIPKPLISQIGDP